MGLLDWFRRADPPGQNFLARDEVGTAVLAYSLDDPRLLEFMRLGEEAITGRPITVESALRNPTMFRAVSLITTAIGMLPTNLLDRETGEKARGHALYPLLHDSPNAWMSAYDFKCLMQMRALVKGDAYALIVRSKDLRTNQPKVVRLVPLDPDKVTPVMNSDCTVSYRYRPNGSAVQTFAQEEVFHLRGGLSLDGISGLSLVKQARDAIGIAAAAEMAAGRLFRNGVLASAALKHQGKLSLEAYNRLKASLAEKEGAENAGKTLILEEGMDFATIDKSARDSQLLELRKHQVEEIGRVMGVPRPLLMVDETSWGSGIEALGQFFVGYTLNNWFSAWQETAQRVLLTDEEKDRYIIRFNPGALLRGSLKDQAEYLSKALGAGGHQPWMYADEARDFMDMPKRDDPPNQMMGHNGGPPLTN